MDDKAVQTGLFCWVDLAATDAERAKAFYAELFGWSAEEQQVNGGVFTRLRLDGQDVGSLYQLQRRDIELGAPSHWTPYVRVDDVEAAAARAAAAGGQVMVEPFVVAGMAKVALILDAVGALIGLWEDLAPDTSETASATEA